MGQKGILVSADNSCKIMLRITVRIIPDFEHPEHFEMFQAPRSRQFYNSDAFIRPFMRVYISSAMRIKFRDHAVSVHANFGTMSSFGSFRL